MTVLVSTIDQFNAQKKGALGSLKYIVMQFKINLNRFLRSCS